MIQVDDLAPTVSLIDFGLARLFRSPATYLHTPYSTNNSVVGTLPFTSINAQRGYAQLRHNDLESLAYTIVYSARGNLPWTRVATGTYSDKEAVLQKKSSTSAEELCKGLPAPFCKFVSYTRSLGFDEKPDYQYLHSILSQCSEAETNQLNKVVPSACSPLSFSDQG